MKHWKSNFGKSFVAAVLFCIGAVLIASVPAMAAQGSIRTFKLLDDAETDVAGAGTSVNADSLADAGFSVSLSGAGAITRVILKNTTANKTWDTSTRSGNPVLVVKAGEQNAVANTSGGIGIVPFIIGGEISVWVNDRKTVLADDATFEITLHFVDKSTVTSKIDVKGLPKPAAEIKIAAAEYKGAQKLRIEGLQRAQKKGKRQGRGDDSLVTEVKLSGTGVVSGFSIRNTLQKEEKVWDTGIDDKNDLLIVISGDAQTMLNKENGNIEIPVNGEVTFRLVVENDEAFANERARKTLLVHTSDGKTIQHRVEKSAAPQPAATGEMKIKSVEYRGKGAYDFVGDGVKPAANLTPDKFIAVSLEASGTLTGIKITGSWEDAAGKKHTQTWDTLATGNNPAIAVTRADGKPLNRLDGSISEALNGSDSLLLWFDTNKGIAKKYTFAITMLFSDGKVLEGKAAAQ